jgi:hypothetical protein
MGVIEADVVLSLHAGATRPSLNANFTVGREEWLGWVIKECKEKKVPVVLSQFDPTLIRSLCRREGISSFIVLYEPGTEVRLQRLGDRHQGQARNLESAMKKNDAFMERMQAEMSGFDRVEDIAQIYQIIEEWVVCTVCEVVAAKRELDLVSE